MRVLVIAQGTRGDVQPFVALAKELGGSECEVVLCGPEKFAPLAVHPGVCYRQLVNAADFLMSEPAVREAFEINFRGRRGKQLLPRVMSCYRSTMSEVLSEIAAVAECSADVLVYDIALPLHGLGERMGVPAVPVCLQPFWIPTHAMPNPMLPANFPGIMNYRSYAATRLWYGLLMGSAGRWRRKTLGLTGRSAGTRWRTADGAWRTVLQAFSKVVLPRPGVYPDDVHTTGFWFLEEEDGWTPPDALVEFVESGDRPIYVGFGSMAGADPSATANEVVAAVRKAGRKAVVATGGGGLDPHADGDDLLYIDKVPHHWLFPRMAAVVHHGGAGTTGAALAAGRPQVVCPFASDQPFFARRMYDLGAAPSPQPQRNLTVAGLADAIVQATTDEEMRLTACRLGERVRAEGGTRSAVQAIRTTAERERESLGGAQ